MALMNLYQNRDHVTEIDKEYSPIRKSHYFTIGVVDSSLVEEEASFNASLNIEGIMDTLPAISYQTSWDASPVSVISENVKNFTDNAAIRTFAQNNGHYRMPIVTDGWTQLMPKDGCALSVSLSFKSYPTKMFSTTDFRSILNFLFFVTTPREYYLSDSAAYIGQGLEQAYAKGKELGNLINQAANDFKSLATENERNATVGNQSYLRLANYMIASPDEKPALNEELSQAEQILAKELDTLLTYFNNLLNMSDDNAGGVPLCVLKVPGMINAADTVRWLIKSWSFKPAINTIRDVKSGLELPMFVEFKIDLETQTILSNSDMNKLLG